jgi:hypothetical protein
LGAVFFLHFGFSPAEVSSTTTAVPLPSSGSLKNEQNTLFLLRNCSKIKKIMRNCGKIKFLLRNYGNFTTFHLRNSGATYVYCGNNCGKNKFMATSHFSFAELWQLQDYLAELWQLFAELWCFSTFIGLVKKNCLFFHMDIFHHEKARPKMVLRGADYSTRPPGTN